MPPPPVTLTFDLLTLKVVSVSHVRWATFVPISVFVGLFVLDLGPIYATDVRQTDRRQTASSLNAPPRGREHNNRVMLDVRPRSEPSLERMRVGMAPMKLTRPVDQVAPGPPHHRSHADIVLSPTPTSTPPPTKTTTPVHALPPWQQPQQPPQRARATVEMSPQPAPVVPAPSPVRTAISPVAAPKPVPPPPKQSDLLAYIRDEEK